MFCFVLVHWPQLLSCELYYTNLVKIFIELDYFEILSWIVWYDYICLCAYMLLVVIYVVCIYVVGGYICLCAYMLLVNFHTCYWCWIVGVGMYWNMLVWICGIRMKYVLLLSSPKVTHNCCWISSPCWWRILMYSIMQGDYDMFVASGATA